MNVIVLGAGIGGLSMALMLHARGIPVRLEALLSTFLPDDTESQPFAGP